MKTFHAIHIAAIFGGVLAFTSNTSSDLQWGYEQAGTWMDSNLAIIGALNTGALITSGAIGSAIGSNRPFHTKAIWASALMGVWVICSIFSLAISTDRIASDRDEAIARKSSKAEAVKVTQRLYEHAEVEVNKWCATRRGKPRNHLKCKRWTATADHEKKLLERYRTDPVLVPDSLGPRISRVAEIAGVTVKPKDVGVVVPLLAPLGLLMLGSILLAFGMAGERPEFEVEETIEDRAKRMIKAYAAKKKKPTSLQIAHELKIPRHTARRMINRYA